MTAHSAPPLLPSPCPLFLPFLSCTCTTSTPPWPSPKDKETFPFKLKLCNGRCLHWKGINNHVDNDNNNNDDDKEHQDKCKVDHAAAIPANLWRVIKALLSTGGHDMLTLFGPVDHTVKILSITPKVPFEKFQLEWLGWKSALERPGGQCATWRSVR